MRNKSFRSVLSLLLAVIMTGSLFNFALPTEAEAATAEEADEGWYIPTELFYSVCNNKKYHSHDDKRDGTSNVFIPISSYYGKRDAIKTDNGETSTTNHRGIDISQLNGHASCSGKKVYATRSGKATTVAYSSARGYNVIISHDSGYESEYLHMQEFSATEASLRCSDCKICYPEGIDICMACEKKLEKTSIKKGDTVLQGAVIGLVGNTGNSKGAHLHFAIMKNGSYINPSPAGVTHVGKNKFTAKKGESLGGTITYKTELNIGKSWLLAIYSKETYVKLKTTKKADLRAEPYESSTRLDTLPKGTDMLATKLVQNKYNNCWYMVTVNNKTGYMYAGNVKFVDVADDILSATYTDDIKTHTKNKRRDLKGTITAKTEAEVTGAIRYRDGSLVSSDFQKSKTIGSYAPKTLNIQKSNINDGISMKELGNGAYRYQVDATAKYWIAETTKKMAEKEHKKEGLIVDDFTVGTVYTVMYDPNGGQFDEIGNIKNTNGELFNVKGELSEGKLKTYYTSNKTALGSLPAPKKEGYTFDGWYTAKSGGDKIGTDKKASNVTYYAHWTAGFTEKHDTYVYLKVKSGGRDDIKKEPYTASDTVGHAKSGLLATEIVKNSYGNWWYKVTANGVTGYIWVGDIEFEKVPDDIVTKSYTDDLKKIAKGTDPALKGTVTAHSNVTLTNVTGSIHTKTLISSDKVVQSKALTPKTTTQNIEKSDIDTGIKINEIGKGDYWYQVDATVKYWFVAANNKQPEERSYTKERLIKDEFSIKETYTITFDANGGSGAPKPQTKWDDEDLTLSKTKPTRSGYTFDHWCKDPDGFWHDTAYKKYQPGDKYTKNENVTLYAHWEKAANNIYTVSFEPNIGSEGGYCKNYNPGDSYGQLPTPTYSGYTFQGWYTQKSGGTKITSDTKVPGNTTIYGHWTKNATTATYTIDFDYNMGGTGGVCKQYKSGDALGTLPTPTRSGYSLEGWYTAKSGGSKISSATKVTGNATYYAHWTQQSDYMTGCTRYPSYGRVKVQTADYVYSLPCDSSTDSRSGKGAKQSVGTWLTVDGLYKNSKGQYWYSLEQESGGGYISAASTASYQCMPLTSDVKLTNAVYPDGIKEGQARDIGGTISSKRLYLNEVSGYIEDSYGTLLSKTLTYSNSQKCTGVNLKSSDINTALKFGKMKAGLCLYVITVSADYYYSSDGSTLSFWRQTEDLIRHDFVVVASGKSVRFMSDGKVVYSTVVTQTNNYLTIQPKPYDKPGYTFKGWNVYRDTDKKWYTTGGHRWQTQSSIDKNNYTKTLYTPGKKYDLYHDSWGSGSYTFYAVWQNTSTGKDLRFVNEGTVVSSVHATLNNKTVTIADAPAGQPGYTFLGWNAQRDKDGTWYVGGVGWLTESNISANNYAKKLYAPKTNCDVYDSTWVDEASVTFYALWKEPVTYTVAYDANGGTGAPAEQQKIAGTDLTLSGTVPVRQGYSFLGWATSKDAISAQYQPGAAYTDDAAVTLYAVWEAQTGIVVPDVTGMYIAEAQTLLALSGFDARFDFWNYELVQALSKWDESLCVTTQTPAAGTYAPVGELIRLTTADTAQSGAPRLKDRFMADDASVLSWNELGRHTLVFNSPMNPVFKYLVSGGVSFYEYTTDKLCQVELAFTGDLPTNDYEIYIVTENVSQLVPPLSYGSDYYGSPDTVLIYINKGSYEVILMEPYDPNNPDERKEYGRAKLDVTGSGLYTLNVQANTPPAGDLSVPDVTGMYIVEARLLLRMSGFDVQDDLSGWDESRCVAAQTPAAGAYADAGSTVTLTTTDTAPAVVPRLKDKYPIDDAAVRSMADTGESILGYNYDGDRLVSQTAIGRWPSPINYTTEKLCQAELNLIGELPTNEYVILITPTEGELHVIQLTYGSGYFGSPGTILTYLSKGSYDIVLMDLTGQPEEREFTEYGRVTLNVTGSGRYDLTVQPYERIAVPDLTGLSVSEARTQLEALGFAVYSEECESESDLVARQMPAPGVMMKPGSVVSIFAAATTQTPIPEDYPYAVIDAQSGIGLAWSSSAQPEPDSVERDSLSQTLSDVTIHIVGSGYQGYPMKITPCETTGEMPTSPEGGYYKPETGLEVASDENGDISLCAVGNTYALWIEAVKGKYLCFPFTVSGGGTIDIDLSRKINVSYYNEDGSFYKTDEVDTSAIFTTITLGAYDVVKDGYTFAGWSSDGGTPTLPGNFVFTAFDISFTAVWTEDPPEKANLKLPEPTPEPTQEPTPEPTQERTPEPTPEADTGTDAGADTGADTGTDAGADLGADAGADTGTDVGADLGADAGADTGTDVGADTGAIPEPEPEPEQESE